jgi:hypothetical protein
VVERDESGPAIHHSQTLCRALRTHSKPAAASLREGMPETLTVTRLGIEGKLKQTLESTNPCESMIECVRRSARNVKRWRDGEMALRWTAAGMLEAERQFRRVIGYRDLGKLAVAVEREVGAASPPSPATKECSSPLPCDRQIGTAVEVPRRAGHAREPRPVGLRPARPPRRD